MNPFLEELFDKTAIDVKHLESYLSSNERQYLDNKLQSIEDLDNNLYTDNQGENLEVLLQFLVCHKDEITEILREPTRKEILMALYTSSVISGNYDCFRFDLSKFEKTYNSTGRVLILYRIGREGEDMESLGNSWSKRLSGLMSYAQSSAIDGINRPVFEAKINDSEVLFEVNSQEDELILKCGFKYVECKILDSIQRQQVFS